MHLNEIKEAIKAKTQQFEIALEMGRPHNELLGIYKELKELQYQKTQKELAFLNIKDADLV